MCKLMQLIRELEKKGGKNTFVVLQWALTREMQVVTRNKTLVLIPAEGSCLCFQEPLDIR